MERPERGRRHNNSNKGRRRQGEGEARAEETHSQEEGVAEKRPRTEKSDTKTETVGGETGPSQSRMTNIYLTDSDKQAIAGFVKDHEE